MEGEGEQYEDQRAGGQPDQPAQPVSVDQGHPVAVVPNDEATDIPPPDEILKDPEALAEANRLRNEVFDALETVPEYLMGFARWGRVTEGNQAKINFRFEYGKKVLEIIIANAHATVRTDDLIVRVFPEGTSTDTEKFDSRFEQSMGIRIPRHDDLHPDIKWNGPDNPSAQTREPRNSRKAVARIEGLINEIKTGFAEPTAP